VAGTPSTAADACAHRLTHAQPSHALATSTHHIARPAPSLAPSSRTARPALAQGANAPADTVKLAFKRAASKSLGSICLGSLLVAIVKTVRALVSQARSQADQGGIAAFALCCVDCLLGCLDNLMQYFNHYAYTRVALYGEPFVTAAKGVWAMVRSKGLEALIRDDLIGNVLFFGCLIGGCISAVIACSIALGSGSTVGAIILAAILGFLVGFMITQQTTELVQSATATIFVSYGARQCLSESTPPPPATPLARAAGFDGSGKTRNCLSCRANRRTSSDSCAHSMLCPCPATPDPPEPPPLRAPQPRTRHSLHTRARASTRCSPMPTCASIRR
jgi:hypothetical protein